MAISRVTLRNNLQVVMPDGRDASDMTGLINQSIDDAVASGRRWLWEKSFRDITGDGTTQRWELTGEEVMPASPEEQITPTGLATTYIAFTAAPWLTDELGRIVVEQNTNALGALVTSGTLMGTITTTTAIASGSVVRFYFYRRPIEPSDETFYLPIPERYIKPASFANLHAYLAQNGMSGESENHEKWATFYDTKAETALKEILASAPQPEDRLRVVQ